MDQKILSFKKKLFELPISENDKEELHSLCEDIGKDITKLTFQNKQNEKVKSMTINLLQTTVNELQVQKDIIAQVNDQLLQQKELLEAQSQQLAQHLQALQLSYYELEQFAFVASHDLKSPLRNISGYSQLLKKRYYNVIGEEANSFIDFIVDNTKIMSDTITHILEYSGLNNESELSLGNFDRIIEAIKYEKRELIASTNATIECGNLPRLWIQKHSIVQLLNHLIDNAIKYRANERPHITISAVENEYNNSWLFSVKDNGIGLDEAYQDKAFKLFQRIDNRHLPGEGMGLAICRKVVKMHGGDIWFKQNPEGGTTFFFTISQVKLENAPNNLLTKVA